MNEELPSPDDILSVYKKLFESNEKSLTDEQTFLLNWFITTAMPMVHVSSRAKNNWRPFAFVGGSPPLYSSLVTASDEAFALFLLKHYRIPPGGAKGIEKMDEALCRMIVEYRKKLKDEGIDVTEGASEEIVEINDNGKDDDGNYVDLETVGWTTGV